MYPAQPGKGTVLSPSSRLTCSRGTQPLFCQCPEQQAGQGCLHSQPSPDTCLEVRSTQLCCSPPAASQEQTHQPSTKSHLPPQSGLKKSFCRSQQCLFTQRGLLNSAESFVPLPDLVLFLPACFEGSFFQPKPLPGNCGACLHQHFLHLFLTASCVVPHPQAEPWGCHTPS